jgi:hypothetical protein
VKAKVKGLQPPKFGTLSTPLVELGQLIKLYMLINVRSTRGLYRRDFQQKLANIVEDSAFPSLLIFER